MTKKSKVPMPSDVIQTPGMTDEEYYQARKVKRAEFFECMKKKSAEIAAMQKANIRAYIEKTIEEVLAKKLNKNVELKS